MHINRMLLEETVNNLIHCPSFNVERTPALLIQTVKHLLQLLLPDRPDAANQQITINFQLLTIKRNGIELNRMKPSGVRSLSFILLSLSNYHITSIPQQRTTQINSTTRDFCNRNHK